MNGKDVLPPIPSWYADLYLAIESSRSSQRRIYGFLSVGGCDHDHVPSSGQSIHQCEQLCDHTSLHLPIHIVTVGRYGIDLIYEHYAGRTVLCLIEHIPQTFLGLSIIAAHDLRALYREE